MAVVRQAALLINHGGKALVNYSVPLAKLNLTASRRGQAQRQTTDVFHSRHPVAFGTFDFCCASAMVPLPPHNASPNYELNYGPGGLIQRASEIASDPFLLP